MTDIVVPLDPPDDGGGGIIPTPPPIGCTLAELRQSVRTVTKDSMGVAISDDDIDGWLNEAQRDIATRLAILQREAVGTSDSNGRVPLPSDLITLHWLKFDGANSEVQFVNDSVFMSWLDDPATSQSMSTVLGRIFAEQVETFPAQATAGYTLRYQYDPAEMILDTDKSSLTRYFCPKMVNYARAHAMYKDGDGNMGDRYLVMYERDLPSGAYGRGRLAPGPMTMSFQRGPFDTHDARHF